MENKYDDRILVNYLDGSLDPTEKQLVEQEMEKSDAIQERLDLMQFTIRAIKFKAYKSSVKEIQHDFLQHRIENKSFTSVSTPKLEGKVRSMQFWIKIAASLLFLCSLGYVLWLFQADGEQLYETNFISYEIALDRGAGLQENQLESLYINGEFYQMFQVSEETNLEEFNSFELLLLGTAALELNNPAEAMRYLQKIDSDNIQNQSDDYQDEVDFFMAMAYLKQGAYEQALHLVTKMRSDEQHKYHSNFSWSEEISIRLQQML
ncbi:hypothetical protein [Cyclobacterium jeungdonense]|uniref:Zinc-finger domain-containing protein n=1 Tax=Cyclobacterium jeungdonense TaxID=708087 RepID=A0ABT8CCG3_9BACT|nr:hypothetical protein [Cyclobacterium jeungdonense]MDN3689371.1 hypothetical protein [Cyclobacterium jeungdonense]